MPDSHRIVVTAQQAAVTLVDGSTFCVSESSGDIRPHGAEGLMVRDTRLLSTWELRVDGAPLEALHAVSDEPYEAVFVARAGGRAGQEEPTLVVERHRFIGQGLREDITLRNYGTEPAGVDLQLQVDADFADLFEVKEMRVQPGRGVVHQAMGGDLVFWLERGNGRRGVRISAAGALASDRLLRFTPVVPPGGAWTTTVEAVPSVDEQELAAAFPAGTPPEHGEPARRMQDWRSSLPRIRVEHRGLARALARGEEDLGALRISDPAHPEDSVVAAGAPWFMALFGRDSLLTSAMLLPYSRRLALGTLRTLARLQGERVQLMSEEQPGRILHEVRLGAELSLALGGQSVYYGSIDATPLFVMLVGQAARWGASDEELEPLLPAVDRALHWILEYGDADGDGLVEYRRFTDRGLLHQGWKDSQDAISFRDGTPARPAIALAEVQGYCYAAFLAQAELLERFGRAAAAPVWRQRAAELKQRFHERFWLPEEGYYAIALDRDKQPVDAIASNIGHCLWTGIVDERAAPAVVERLLSPELFTGFGVRTLGTGNARYNPVSYHNGSVWPHDSAIAAAGMARYGFTEGAARVAAGLIDAAEFFRGRLPELFAGFDRGERPVPVPYPTSCSPQAWAAAAPFELLRTLLGLEPAGEEGVRVRAVPAMIGAVSIDSLTIGGAAYRIQAGSEGSPVVALSGPAAEHAARRAAGPPAADGVGSGHGRTAER